jgi:hypothetical protein
VTAAAFRFKANLADLPDKAGRALIEQFRSLQNDLDSVRGPPKSATPVINAPTYNARVGELVLLAPQSATVKQFVTIPAGSAQNITQRLSLAVVGGILSPGVAVSIVGNKGTINGAVTLNLNSFRLVELVSCGPLGWFFSS